MSPAVLPATGASLPAGAPLVVVTSQGIQAAQG